jgi:threonine synthase
MPYTLRCFICGKINNERETTTYCTYCNGVLTVKYDNPSGSIQYPIRQSAIDPLRSYPTELKRLTHLSDRYGCEIWAKMELQNPSGCFKDRGSFIEVLKALEFGSDAICLASTGNMAASVAMYSAYFDIPCYVFVPENTTEGKLAQASIYGAKVLRIKGDFSACEQLCKSFAKSGNYYLAGDYVFREEGQKSFSYEVIEQQQAPFDYILVPVGCGTNFAAIYKGFSELKISGIIEHVPAMICIQPEKSSPVVEGVFKREKVVKDSVSTQATAVAAADPIDFYKVLDAIDKTNGMAFTVSEENILQSLREMASMEAVFTEPACALPLAALKNELSIFSGKRVLLVLTGTGLKDTGVVSRNVLPSPVIKNDVQHVLDYLDSGYPDIQEESFGKPRDTLLTQIKFPAGKKELFEKYLQKINQRGKSLTTSEREVLQALVFNDDTSLEYPVTVSDYSIIMKKNGLVHAKVMIQTIEGEMEVAYDGVGPLDAVLGAIQVVTESILPVILIDHHLEVLSPGTNALVIASIRLSHNGFEVEAKAASTDVIEAGLDAWTKCYAMLYKKNING